MLEKELYKKILYFNSKDYFTKEELVKELGIDNLMILYLCAYSDNIIAEFLQRCNDRNFYFLTPELESKIKKILELDTVTEEIIDSNFSTSEKLYILEGPDYLFSQIKEKCYKVKFLTNDEVINLLKNNVNIDYDIFNYIRDDKVLIPFIKEMNETNLSDLIFCRNEPFSPEVVEVLLSIIPLTKKKYNNSIKDRLIESLTVEQIIRLINISKDRRLTYNLVIELPTNLKLQYLHKVAKYERARVIASIEEDDIKAKLINYTTPEKGLIISSIKSDQTKEKLFNRYRLLLSGEDLGRIISSFQDNEYVKKYFYLLKSESSKVGFINWPNDNQEEYKVILLESLKRKSSIMECLHIIRYSSREKELVSKIFDQKILLELFFPINNEANMLIFRKLSEKNKEEAILLYREGSECILDFYQYLENDDFLYESISHTMHFPDYNPSYDNLITRVANYKHLDAKKLIKLASIFGLTVLSKIENVNIINLLSASDEDFSKILMLLGDDITKFEEKNQNDALNALIQRKFRVKYPAEILIFTETRHAVDDNNIDLVIKLVDKISEIVSLDRFNITKEKLIEGLMKEDKEITELYHKITNEYLKILRANYDIEEKKLADLLYNDKPYDKNALVKYVLKNLPISIIIQKISNTKKRGEDVFTPEENELITNTELLQTILEFKKNPQNVKISNSIKNNIKNAEEIIRKVYSNQFFSGVKRNSAIKKTDKSELLEVLCELNINQIEETVLTDEEKFQELLAILRKRKIPSWLGRFGELPKEADITLVASVVASLINNYSEIRKHIFKEEANKIRDILTEAIKEYNEIDISGLLLEGMNEKSFQKTDVTVSIKEISQRTNIPVERLIKNLLTSANLLRTDNFESAINILSPEIKSIYSKDRIKQLLEKINDLRWQLSFEKRIKVSLISPTENELKNLLSIIKQIHNIIPELQDSFILENLFDSAVIYNNIDLEEALLNIDERMKNKLSKENIEKILISICSFIKNIKKGNIVSSTAILDFADCYDSSSKILRILFGKETFDLIKRNPPPYQGDMTSHQRIEIAIKLIKTIHNRKYVTVPPSRDVYTLHNNKKIEISVGDLHNFDNLTYGERTKACMRIGGAAYSLFNFCLENENGFHVKFVDPENDKLVSRVSGFRNGNTVFLNQLRFSLSEKYTTEDLVNACKLFAQRLINDSKDSTYPIENVVISPGYAMAKHKKESKSLGKIDIKKGFKIFYSDVSASSVIILATSNPDNSLVPVKVNPNNSVKYESLRRGIKRAYGQEAYRLKYQILLLDEYYSNNNYEDVEINEQDDVIYSVQGEDWYIAVDSKGSIDNFIMKSSNNREKALEEMSRELEKLKEYISKFGLEEIKEKSSLGGAI